MPNLPCHIELAYQVLRRLHHPTLDVNLGYFLLGSTSPDIRVITCGRREQYHFAPLDFGSVGAGVAGLFDSHPHLASVPDHDGPMQAFVAGYVTHLIADEIWIVKVFRPFFGNPDVFEDRTLGRVMDRALQLELDRQAWSTVETSLTPLRDASEAVDIGFIPSETLDQWRQWLLAFLEHGFSWDRLQFMARRIADGDENHSAHLVASEFLRAIPQSLERLYRLVPRRAVQAFRERTITASVHAVGEYLP